MRLPSEGNSPIFPRSPGSAKLPSVRPNDVQSGSIPGKFPTSIPGRTVLSPQARLALLIDKMRLQPYNHRRRPWLPNQPMVAIQPVYGMPHLDENRDRLKPDYPIQPVYGAPNNEGVSPWKPDTPIQPVYGAPNNEGASPWNPNPSIQPVYGAPSNEGVSPWKPDTPIQPVYGAPRKF